MTPEKPVLEIPAAIRFWVDVFCIVSTIIGVISTVGWHLVRGSFVSHRVLADTLEPMGEMIDKHGDRLLKLESDFEHMPDSSEFAELRDRMTRLEGVALNIQTQVTGVHELLERIERPLNVLIDGKLKDRAG
jgi:hypothetical protein